MALVDKSSLYSTLTNTSGSTKKFGFLPPHGQELAAGEQITVFGNILEAVTRFERVTDRRHHQALAAAIDNGDIQITSTPAPVLTDTVTGDVKVLTLASGTLDDTDPSWSDTVSEGAVPP